MADNVAVLRDGTVAQHAAPSELYAGPIDHQLASFIGAANLIDGRLEPSSRNGETTWYVRTALGRLPARCNGKMPADPCAVMVLIRPEQITVATPSDGDGPLARVLSRGFHGHDTVLNVQLTQDHEAQPLLVRALGSPPLAPGDRCTVTCTGTALVWAPESQQAG